MPDVIEKIQHRYEQKFVFQKQNPAFVEDIVIAHPANFVEIFHQRQVNNIYFDHKELSFYSDHIKGNADRQKVRIRWYGETFGRIINPRLEFKLRNGELRIKKSYQLPEFTIEKGFQAEQLKEIFENANLPTSVSSEINALEARLLNMYNRRYFKSDNNHFRFTIDHKLEYIQFLQQENSFSKKEVDDENIILELKFSPEFIEHADDINKVLPKQCNNFSKYVSGIEKLYAPII